VVHSCLNTTPLLFFQKQEIATVERCFVHMDYETDHAPEYKRRLNGGGAGESSSPPGSPAATPLARAPTKRAAAAVAT
jgi:hypothetical protein